MITSIRDKFSDSNFLLKFILLWLYSLGVLCSGLVSPALPLIKEHFSDVPNISFKIKMMVTLPNFFIAISAPLFGYLAKKVSKKLTLIASLVLYGISGTAGYYLPTVETIMISRIFLGISIAALITLSTALVAENFKDAERNMIISLQTSVMSVCSIIYGILGGILGDINWRLVFTIYGISFFVIPFAISILKEDKRTEDEKAKTDEKDERKIQNIYAIILICLMNWVVMILFYTIKLQLPFMIYNILDGANAKKISYILAFEVIFSAYISIKYKRIRKNREFATIANMAFMFIAMAFMIISFANSYLMMIIGMILYGVGMGFIMPNSTLWLISLTKSRDRALFVGLFTASTYIGKFASPIILDPIVKNFGAGNAFRLESIFCIGVAILTMYLNEYFKRVNVTKLREMIMRRKNKKHAVEA